MRKRIIIAVLVCLVLILGIAVPSVAATTATVTVTNTPSFIAITIAPTTLTLNTENSGSGKVSPSTTYYTNPLGGTTAPSATVVDAECEFTVTNTSTIVTDLTATSSDMSGGSDNSTNGNTGSAGATSYGAWAYYSGETFASKVAVKSSGSTTGNSKASLAASTNIKVGFEISEQTNAWTGPTSATFTYVITATAH